jgi:hypothetical protein
MRAFFDRAASNTTRNDTKNAKHAAAVPLIYSVFLRDPGGDKFGLSGQPSMVSVRFALK